MNIELTEADHRNNAATLAACLRGISNSDLIGVGEIITNLSRIELELLTTLTLTHLANAFIEAPSPAFENYISYLNRIGQGPTQ